MIGSLFLDVYIISSHNFTLTLANSMGGDAIACVEERDEELYLKLQS